MIKAISNVALRSRLKNAELANKSLMIENKKLKGENTKLMDKNKEQIVLINKLADTLEQLTMENTDE